MAIYPAYLSPEEKLLKKRYAKLQEKRKLLRKALEKPPTTSVIGKQPQKDLVSPKDAKEAAKKLLVSGKLTIAKKSPVKRSGFKRVGERPGQCPPAKRPNTAGGGSDAEKTHSKPKTSASDVKELYHRFVKPSNLDDLERIPKKLGVPEASQPSQPSPEKTYLTQDCTVLVNCLGISEEALRIAFRRFGEILTLTPHRSKGESFITFKTPDIANTARKEMNNGMVHGSDVFVEAASKENGFVELPPDAAKHPWAQLAAGRTLTDSPVKRKLDSQRPRHKEMVSYEADFI